MDYKAGVIIEAIPKTKERIALARPRTRKPKNPEAHAFGERVAQMRKARGLSQVELAEVMEIHQTDISDLERGDRWPQAPLLARLAKTLRVSIDELLGLKQVKSNGDDVYRRRIFRRLRRIESLSKRDQQALLRVLDNALAGANGQRVA